MRGLWTAAAGLLTLNAIGASPLLKPTRHHMLSEKAILYSPFLVKKETLYAGIFYTVQSFALQTDRKIILLYPKKMCTKLFDDTIEI